MEMIHRIVSAKSWKRTIEKRLAPPALHNSLSRRNKMKRVLTGIVIVASFVVEALGQASKPVPVYPGATLVIEQGKGTQQECCDFSTTDSFEKVLTFYEKQLKTKPLDTKALAAKYPAIKQQVQMLEQQIPAGTKLRAFVLEEVTMNGQKSPVLFEVVGSPQSVHFSIGGESLAGNDAQFARTWREKTGKLTADETAQKESDQRQVNEDKEQKERDERHAKEEPAYRAKVTTELLKFLKQNKTDLYPGVECEHVYKFEGEISSGWSFYYTSKDDFKKVYDFYAARNKAVKITNSEGGLSGWSKYETVCSWRMAEFLTQSSLRIEVREVSLTNNGPKTTYVAVTISSDELPKTIRKIDEEYRSRW
jgi:hypothetical protein